MPLTANQYRQATKLADGPLQTNELATAQTDSLEEAMTYALTVTIRLERGRATTTNPVPTAGYTGRKTSRR